MKTTDELAKEFGLQAYDTALPQPWVDLMRDKYHRDVRGHFVWSYDVMTAHGEPIPLTPYGAMILCERRHANDGRIQ